MPIHRPLFFATLFAILSIFASSWFLIGVFVLLLDARARYSDYKLHQHLSWSPHLGNKFKRSWCSRGVAQFIWGNDAKAYYNNLGYKWYHVFPEKFPIILFTRKFWNSILYGLGK